MKFQYVTTEDGSKTLFHPIGDHYHSTHGAINEAKHVFLKEGLFYTKAKDVHILEVGFGTGLNAYLTYLNVQDKIVHYISIEPSPLSIDVVSLLNYPEKLDSDRDSFLMFHACPFDVWHRFNEQFQFKKLQKSLQSLHVKEPINLIYYDAFGPRHQPELWEESCLKKCYDLLDNQGILVTYCAKGSVKRALRSIGFDVETCPGPPGKREMIRAIKR